MSETEVIKLEHVDSPALTTLYNLVEELKAEDLRTAKRKVKAGATRLRKILMQIDHQCKAARKDLIGMVHDGQIRSR